MASWKKMAEAFGRALGQSGGTIKRDLNKAERSILDVGYNHRDDALGNDFRKGARDGTEDRIEAEARAETAQDKGARGSLKQLTDNELDRINDAASDERLAKTEVDRINSELWNRAFMSADKDLQSNQLWHIISDLRNKGITEADILNLLRSMGK